MLKGVLVMKQVTVKQLTDISINALDKGVSFNKNVNIQDQYDNYKKSLGELIDGYSKISPCVILTVNDVTYALGDIDNESYLVGGNVLNFIISSYINELNELILSKQLIMRQ